MKRSAEMSILESVKFEHDNRKDSLTGSDAQIIFYRHLLRAIAMRKRNGGALFMITVQVIATTKIYKRESIAGKDQVRKFEEELKRAGFRIRRNLRAQDFYTRMAVDGFYILISGEKGEEEKLTERFKRLFADRALYRVLTFKLIGDLSPTEWLNEVDNHYFTPPKSE